MTEYKELYIELTAKIKELKRKYQELQTKRNKIGNEKSELEKNIQSKEQELTKLEEEKKQIICKRKLKTIACVSIMCTVVVLLSWIVVIIRMPQLVTFLSTILTNLTDLAIKFLAGFVVIPSIFFLEFFSISFSSEYFIKKRC